MKPERTELIAFIDETMDDLRFTQTIELARWFPNKWILQGLDRTLERLDDIRNEVAVL